MVRILYNTFQHEVYLQNIDANDELMNILHLVNLMLVSMWWGVIRSLYFGRCCTAVYSVGDVKKCFGIMTSYTPINTET